MTTYVNDLQALSTLIESEIMEQISNSAVLFHYLPKKDSVSRHIEFLIANSQATAHGEFATVSEAFAVSKLALDAAAATGNPLAVTNLLHEELINSTTRLISSINKQLYIGYGGLISSAQTIQGLVGDKPGNSGWLSVSNTVFDQSQTLIPSWRSNILINGGTPRNISFDLLKAGHRVVNQFSGQNIQLWICDGNQWSKLATQQQQENDNNIFPIKLYYKGIPIVADKHCPAGVVLGLTLDNISLQQLPFGKSPDYSTINISSDSESLPFRINIRELPAQKDNSVRYQLYAHTQLVVHRPNAQVLIMDLS